MKKGFALVFLSAVISGVSIYINRFGVTEIDPTVFAGVKNTLVGTIIILFIGASFSFTKIAHELRKHFLPLLAVSLIGGTVPFILFFTGLVQTSASEGAFIHKAMFIFIAILAVRFLKEKLSSTYVLAAIVVIMGNVLMLNILTPFKFNAGDFMILGATILWAIENVISKWLLNKDVSPFSIIFSRMFIGGSLIIAYAVTTGKGGLILSLSDNQMWWIYITALFLTGYVIAWYNGIKSLPLSKAALVLALGSPITTLLTSVTALQFPSITTLTGALFIVGAITILTLQRPEVFSKDAK